MQTARHDTARWGHVAAAVLGLTALLSLLLTAFAWPATNTAPRDLPVAVAAPEPVAAQIEQRLTRAGENAFDATVVGDRAAAVQAIEDREVYGAIVAGPQGQEVLTASAASPAVAQILTRLATEMGAAQATSQGPAPEVTDVVPTPADDPRGAGLAAGALPLVLGGIVTAGVLTARVSGRGARLAGALGVAAVAGPTLTAILQFWLGSLEGDFLANSAVVALGISATATVVLGLERLLGLAGLGLGAAIMVLLGNPLSGLASAPELLPTGWGAVGQLLPPGAMGTALRSVAFFDGAGSGTALLVLASWLSVGVVLCLLPSRRRVQQPASDPTAAEPATV